jgi:hypothetical protein
MNRLFLLAMLSACLATLPAPGHDYWLEPEAFFPTVRKSLTLHLYVGEHFILDSERPFQKKLTSQFRLLSAGDPVDLAKGARENSRPVARVTPSAAGTYLVRMDRKPVLIRLAADKFNAYLKDEGLDSILVERKKRGENKDPGRERYSRCLKALLQAGGRGDDTWKKVVGQKLELIPLVDPFALKPDAKVPIHVLLNGKALAGVKVFAVTRVDGKDVRQDAVTSKDGVATFQGKGAGPWLVRLVYMRRAPKSDKTADWESTWAALTFATAGKR